VAAGFFRRCYAGQGADGADEDEDEGVKLSAAVVTPTPSVLNFRSRVPDDDQSFQSGNAVLDAAGEGTAPDWHAGSESGSPSTVVEDQSGGAHHVPGEHVLPPSTFHVFLPSNSSGLRDRRPLAALVLSCA